MFKRGINLLGGKKVWHRNLSASVQSHLTPNNPDVRGLEAFEDAEALKINDARLSHLKSLDLALSGKRVLDAGCGVGHLAAFFLERACRVVCLDARAENLSALKARYPMLQTRRADVEKDALKPLGDFDIVFCYGLLYHLENPLAALRHMSSVCKSMLLVETMITDHSRPLNQIVGESLSANQALSGIGHRPTPSYVSFVLNRLGFAYLYSPRQQPRHPDFQFQWKNDLEHRRDGHDLRCVFIASRERLNNPKLVEMARG